jgi:hypothetical protein
LIRLTFCPFFEALKTVGLSEIGLGWEQVVSEMQDQDLRDDQSQPRTMSAVDLASVLVVANGVVMVVVSDEATLNGDDTPTEEETDHGV